MNSMVAATLVALVVLTSCGSGADDAAFKTAFVGQCEQEVRSKPGIPAGLDVRGACACAADRAFANKAGTAAYAQTSEGQSAIAQSLARCLQERAATTAPPAVRPAPVAPPIAPPVAAPPTADDPAENEEEFEGEPVE